MHRRKTGPDAFQSELNDALKKRREKEGTGPQLTEETESDSDDSETDDYDDDDFEVYDPVVPKKRPVTPSKRSKNDEYSNLPSFLKDDDDDILGGGGSMFLKGQGQKTFNVSGKKSTFDPLGMKKKPTRAKTPTFDDEDSDESSKNDYEDDPIMKLLRDDKPKKEKKPTAAKRTSAGAKNEFDGGRKSPFQRNLSPTAEHGILSPKGRKSPGGGQRSPDLSLTRSSDLSRVQERGIMSPKGRKSPGGGGRRSPDPSSIRSSDLSRKSPVTVSNDGQERKTRSKSPGSRPKTPTISGKESPELKSILDSIKSERAPDVLSTEHRTKQNKKDTDKSQGFVDFLLDASQPKPAPRKKGSKPSSVDSESVKSPLSRSLSPSSRHPDKKEDLRRQRTISGEREKRETAPHMSPRPDRQAYTSMPLPSLQASGLSLTTSQDDVTSLRRPRGSPPLHKTEKEKSKADADDLLSLFNQAMKEDNVDFQTHLRQKQEEKTFRTPLEEVKQRTAEQNAATGRKQRSSRQLLDNVIENVARHNESDLTSSASSIHDGEKRKSPRTKSGKKSYRTPPRNYQGLGSLTMLKELKKGDATLKEGPEHDISSDDIRKMAYLEWLAKREEEAKKKKKEEAEKEKAEREKVERDRKDKEHENLIVRKKWEEVKKDQTKEKLRAKHKEERQKEIIKAEKEKQKAKGEREAEKVRERMLETAKIQRRHEMRKKHEEERKKNEKERKQKKENKKAVEKWMDGRSEQWVEDRKKEQKEKHKNERAEKREKKEAAKDAEERYNTWREQKDNELKASMRESKLKQRRQRLHIDIDDDDENIRPPWSPANKVIPRRR